MLIKLNHLPLRSNPRIGPVVVALQPQDLSKFQSFHKQISPVNPVCQYVCIVTKIKTIFLLHYSLDNWSGDKLVVVAKNIGLGIFEEFSYRAQPQVRTQGGRRLKLRCLRNQEISDRK